MRPPLWQRIKEWICSKIGHNGKILLDSPGGGAPEICTRCNLLMSTEYSRSRRALQGGKDGSP